MGARLYDPATGRFLQVDPVFGGSCNGYDYTCQDPLNEQDLNGNSATKCTDERQLCLNVTGSGTHVTGISATLNFPAMPYSSAYYVGCTIAIEILVPQQIGQHKEYLLEDLRLGTLTEDEAMRNLESWKAVDQIVPPDGSLTLPDGTKIEAFLTNADGQIVASTSATIEAHPFLWGLFS